MAHVLQHMLPGTEGVWRREAALCGGVSLHPAWPRFCHRRILPSAVGSSTWGSSAASGSSVRCPGLLAGGERHASSVFVAGAHRRRDENGDVATSGGGGAAVAVAEHVTERIEDTELYDEAYNSYLSYAMSVIVSRAIPDVRDGLKPVHRRILYAMHELSLLHNKPFKKCARVVGEVLGKFHPHSDTAVYDSLVRMAQPFAMRQPLVDGHGNFGSLDNDPAAAMRYTECRLTRAAGQTLLADLGPDTVEWQPTFDESQTEPLVLPAVIPNLLINGAAGIAVGLASNIPPHNPGEVVAALRALIADPGITTEQLMQHVRGPDFPTGGEVVVGPELLQAYETGRGSVILRGKATVERIGGGGGRGEDAAAAAVASKGRGRRRGAAASDDTAANAGSGGRRGGADRELVVITEMPYQVFKSDLVAAIAELIESNQLEGASDVRDESDRTGVRVVVEVKGGHLGETVLAQLYKSTKLQINFNYNCTSLLNTKPRQMGLKAMLQAFLDFRCEVVQRRSSASLQSALHRRHLVEGFLRLLSEEGRLDAVVADVRGAADGAAARGILVARHGLSEEQAEAILGLTLRRLTGLEAAKLEQERRELQQSITRLQDILSNRTVLLAVVDQEAAELAAVFPDPRRTALVAAADVPAAPSLESLLPAKPCFLLASRRGFLRRLPEEALTPQNRNTRGKSGIRLRSGDRLAGLATASDRHQLLLLTPDGRMFRTPIVAVPPSSPSFSSSSSSSASSPSASISQISSASGGGSGAAAAMAGPSGSSVANILKIAQSFPIAALVPLPPGLVLPPAATAAATAVPGAAVSDLLKQPMEGAAAQSEAAAVTGTGSAEEKAEGGQEEEEDEEEGTGEGDAVTAPCLVLCSRSGLIKRVALRNRRGRKAGIAVMGLGPGSKSGTGGGGGDGDGSGDGVDELSWAALSSSPGDVVVVASAEGHVLLFPAADLRVARPKSGGTWAMRTTKRRPQDRIADVAIIPAELAPLLGSELQDTSAAAAVAAEDGEDEEEDGAAIQEEEAKAAVTAREDEEGEAAAATRRPAGPCLLLVTAHGIGKRIPLSQLRLGARRQVGMLAIRVATAERARRSRRSSDGGAAAAASASTLRGPDRVVAVLVVRDGDEVIMASRNGNVVRQSVDGIAVQGRITRGTFVMQLDDGDEVGDVVTAPAPTAARLAAGGRGRKGPRVDGMGKTKSRTGSKCEP